MVYVYNEIVFPFKNIHVDWLVFFYCLHAFIHDMWQNRMLDKLTCFGCILENLLFQ